MRGRTIANNIMLAQELVSCMKHPARGNNIAMKLDMEKAYDIVDCQFMIWVLHASRFSERWIDNIWRSVSNLLVLHYREWAGGRLL